MLFYRSILCLLLSCLVIHVAAQEIITQDIKKEYQRALEKMEAYQYEKALYHMYNCQRMEPENVQFNARLAYCFLQLGNYKDARLFYKKVLSLDSINVNAMSNLGLIAERENNFTLADDYYHQLIRIDSTTSYYYKKRATVAIQQAKLAKALKLLGKAHKLNPKDMKVISDMVGYYLELGALEYAEEMAQKGFQLDSNNLKIIYANAKVKNKQTNYPKVIELIERAMAKRDTHSYYQTMISVAYLQLDSTEQALFHLNRLVDQRKDNEHIHYYLSLAYEQLEEDEKRIFHLEQAVEKGISIKMVRYYNELGGLYEQQKAYRKAIDFYQKAYDRSEQDVFLFHLARNHDFYYKDKRMALRLYKKYLATNHSKYKEYTINRISELKQLIHLQASN